MPRIRHERARVRDHADEAREQAGVRQRIQLPFHAFLLIQKPPAAAELYLAGNLAVLKVADHGGEGIIVDGIDVIDDGLRQCVFHLQAVEVCAQRGHLRPIADRIEARCPVRPLAAGACWRCDRRPDAVAWSSLSPRPAPEEQHHVRRELRVLHRAGRLPVARPVEDGGRRRLGAEIRIAAVQPVVGEARAQGVKIVVPPPQRIGEVLQAADIHVAGGRQPLHPGVEDIRQDGRSGLVRTKRGKDARRQAGSSNRPMAGEIVGRIVGGTQVRHMKPVQDAVRAQFRRGQQRVGPLPDARRTAARRAVRRCRSSAAAPGASSDTADCAACAARCRPTPGISRTGWHRRCNSARRRHWPAWRATCSDRPPARSRTDPGTAGFRRCLWARDGNDSRESAHSRRRCDRGVSPSDC
jgi:hypothetical protein